MSAEGTAQMTGVTSRIRIAPVYPDLETMSSSPNGPPATRK
jgi:hypothetical protein